jgi:hypothetical protein
MSYAPLRHAGLDPASIFSVTGIRAEEAGPRIKSGMTMSGGDVHA